MHKHQPASTPPGPLWVERLASLRLGAAARGLIGLACLLGALSLRLELDGFSDAIPLVTFLPAVSLAALLAGWPVGAGVASGAVVAILVFPMHPGSASAAGETWAVLGFIGVAVLNLAVIGALREALARGRARDEWAQALVLAERSMLTELDHRMANTLQAITNLLDRRARASGSADTRRVLEDATGRVMVFARIHRRMSAPSGDIGEFLETLCDDLLTAFGATYIRVSVACDPIALDAYRAETVALVVAELLTNTIKHAFPNRASGAVEVSLRSHGPLLLLEVRDDGVGIDAGGGTKGASLGRSLVGMLAGRLGGEASWDSPEPAGPGTVARVAFPAKP